MKISNITVSAWTTGSIMVQLDNQDSVHLCMTEDESERFRQLAVEIFTSRQKLIAHEIANASPALLVDFTEVEPLKVPIDDDMPF